LERLPQSERLLRGNSHPAERRFQIGARFIEPAEIYPNSEAWGVDGFTFTDKDVAFAKLRELAAQTNSRPWHYLRGRNRNNKSKIKPLF
jgi:hypothetical protein